MRHTPVKGMRRFRAWLSALSVAAVAIAAALVPRAQTPASNQTHTLLSYDLSKVIIPDETPEIMCDYTGFRVSFNPSWHVPNYVVWELTAEETLGTEPRQSRFAADTDVLGCATPQDYRNSGFDRGHMAPAADMKWSRQAMRDSHYMTNIVPQNHNLNTGRWNSLEQKCRTLAQRDSVLVIIAGPILSDRITRTVGSSEVAVPERFFKVIFAPAAIPPRAIAFVMPNRPVRENLGQMAMTVDQLEEITGFDFFSTLPDDIENQIESTFRQRDWGIR